MTGLIPTIGPPVMQKLFESNGLTHSESQTGSFVEPYIQARQSVLQRFTIDYVQDLLEKTRGNITQGARLAGLSRVALQKILRRTGVDPGQYRPE